MSPDFLLHYSYLIAAAPLLAFALIIAFRNFLGLQGAWVGALAMFYGFMHALLIAVGIFNGSIVLPSQGLQGQFFQWSVTWFSVGNFDFRLGVLIDGLSSIMLVVVTLVSFLVQLYSISYMHDHKRFGRYFAYVNLFTFSMLVLVLANDVLQMFVGWELVGLCSYLLVSFDFEREAAAYAGRKAFLTTRVGDLGFYLALLTIFNYLGTFNIPSLFQNYQSLSSFQYPAWVITMVPVLLFLGAMGKSAQFPLHVWLPDAMEGPTPASALIHAATMVAAGVYMIARVYFLFQASPIAMDVVMWVGVVTAVFAASMGLVSEDIKRVLAFSTVSQLGFMMTGLGAGGYEAGMFHLTTHAAFKALLFLCAGSVIHAVHTNDMWKMGGLKTKMPLTFVAYGIGTLAIAGFPMLSGFYSKEEILSATFHHNLVVFGLLAFAAMLTSFYMFRSLFLTFFGTPRDKHAFEHAHESPALMTIPLIVLSLLSVFVGFGMHYDDNLTHWISWGGPHEAPAGAHMIVLATSLAVFTLGLIGAIVIYMGSAPTYDVLSAKFPGIYRVLRNRYYVDELYLWFIDRIYHPLTRGLARADYDVVDQIFIDGNARIVTRISSWVRRAQSGLVQSYLFWMVLGLGAMAAWVAQRYK